MNDMASGATARFDPALRERIEDLLCDYAHSLDDGQIDRWPDFFTETCVYHVTTREGHEAGLPIGIMRCAGRGMMLDRVKAFHTANIFEPHSYNHVLGRAAMALGPGGDTFACRSNFHVFRIMQDGRCDLFATGRYMDTIVLDGGAAKFKQRIVVLDSRQVDLMRYGTATSAEEISPQRAWQMLHEEPWAQLVDVRTEPEWIYVGIPELAAVGKTVLQVFWHLFPGMIDNKEFLAQLTRAGDGRGPAVPVPQRQAKSGRCPRRQGRRLRTRIQCQWRLRRTARRAGSSRTEGRLEIGGTAMATDLRFDTKR